MEPHVDLGLGIYFQLLIVIFSLLTVAFFSSSEASLISVNKFRIRHLVEQGDHAAKAVFRVLEKHDKFFATILLTENAFIILASSVGTAFTISLLGTGPYSVLIATVAMTLLVVVFGEITPKSLAARASEKWARVVGRPVELIMMLETPIIFLFTLIPHMALKLMGGAGRLVTPSVTEGELRMLIDIARSEGIVESDEAVRLESVFRFGDRQVRDMMTPRTEIVFVDRSTSLGNFLVTYAQQPHTRFPIYKETTDNIVGLLSIKDVLIAMSRRQLSPDEVITDFIRDAYYIPETKRIAELFDELRQTGNQMAIAIDEYGGIAGLVTLKRLLEEVVGRVGEEGASPEDEYEAIGTGTFQVDGGMGIDEVKEELGIEIGQGEYETVAGFVLDVLGHIPSQGEQFQHGRLKIEVTEMKGLKIQMVKMTKIPALPHDAS